MYGPVEVRINRPQCCRVHIVLAAHVLSCNVMRRLFLSPEAHLDLVLLAGCRYERWDGKVLGAGSWATGVWSENSIRGQLLRPPANWCPMLHLGPRRMKQQRKLKKKFDAGHAIGSWGITWAARGKFLESCSAFSSFFYYFALLLMVVT